MQRMLIVLLTLYVGAVQAQVVYKCAAKGKPVSFQSEPCASGTRSVKTVSAPPDRYTPPAYQPAPQQQTRYENVVYNNVQTVPDARAQRRANCEAAKRYRENKLDRVGLKRTYDLLQQLDAHVARECKGV